jgi:brefeldin A-inhibited guanine nucleotide-exchange protein
MADTEPAAYERDSSLEEKMNDIPLDAAEETERQPDGSTLAARKPSGSHEAVLQAPTTPQMQSAENPGNLLRVQSPLSDPDTPSTVGFSAAIVPPTNRTRTDSVSTVATSGPSRPSTRSSLVFVVTALETIAASKDARRNKQLGESLNQALAKIKSDGDPSHMDPELLFRPLQLAAEAQTVQVIITALDCIGKLISYSYFSNPSEPQNENPESPPLIERAIDTICDCFQGEATHADVQLQIVKSLLAAILNDKIVVHGAGMLKAVRLTYNIFLLSKSSANQQVAQGALTQMVGTVFERVKSRLAMKEARVSRSRTSVDKILPDEDKSHEDVEGSEIAVDGSQATMDPETDEVNEGSEDAQDVPNDVSVEEHTGPKITLQTFEQNMSFNDERIHDNAPTVVTRVKARQGRSVSGQDSTGSEPIDEDEEDEIYIRDAYLVFRAMCKLSTKSLPAEHALDLRSPSMRSKLLSLHIIHTILHNNIAVFISPYATIRSSSSDEPTNFIQAIKQYLCLSLSRNGASSVNRVFEVSCEIFWLMLKYLRVMLKKEIEVFLKEIYLAILEKRASATFQKQYILTVLSRLAADPRALVEMYLNYDCDRTAVDNMFQRIVEHLSRISSTPIVTTAIQQHAYQEQHSKPNHGSDWASRGTIPPSLSIASMQANQEVDQGYPPEYAMKQESLEALVEILRSMVSWASQNVGDTIAPGESESRTSFEDVRKSMETREGASPYMSSMENGSGAGTPVAEDDPSQLEKAKRHKTALTNAIRQFNFKPKRGLKVLLKEGFIASDSPQDIAHFFLTTDHFDKKALGEFLGEGEAENVAIMHAFVDGMDFTKTRFVDALRRFLQSFRLPGEAQKIDRFMLKFAERYMSGNPNAFANADTAYVLAYSVIMLNTDQHSTKMKGARMTPEDFIKNNRGINDNADLPEEYLRGIYDEIAHNEIVLDTERETAANLGMISQPTGGLASNLGQALGGRDLQREAYMQASEEIASKTEYIYKTLLKQQRRGASRMPLAKFIPASSSKHIGPMFSVTWMPFLTALSGQAQDTQNLEIVRLCMEGLRHAIRISCLFNLEDPRQAFVATLARFTNLYNLSEMKAKNLEALKMLLEIAQNEGNLLKESWRDILTCISQLDRFQLISAGIDEGVVPDVLKANINAPQPKKSLQVPAQRHRPRVQSGNVNYQSDIAEETRSVDVIRGVDRIFTNTANLSGEAIVYFVKALAQVSWQEIQSSGQSESPRTYSLQKIVEISGYNMARVRFEWTNIWQVLGEHFNQVGCHTNTNVVFFALNSLRQLSMKFMEIEELPGFKFQKDFLKPFEHIIANTNVVMVKDMVLRCLIQMIQARGENIRSGWKTMFGVFTVAAREPYGMSSQIQYTASHPDI